jgi:hypothetical protein
VPCPLLQDYYRAVASEVHEGGGGGFGGGFGGGGSGYGGPRGGGGGGMDRAAAGGGEGARGDAGTTILKVAVWLVSSHLCHVHMGVRPAWLSLQWLLGHLGGAAGLSRGAWRSSITQRPTSLVRLLHLEAHARERAHVEGHSSWSSIPTLAWLQCLPSPRLPAHDLRAAARPALHSIG